MPTKPKPTPWGSLRTVSKIDRNLNCPSYDNCLDHAVKENWKGWTCRFCPLRLEAKEFEYPPSDIQTEVLRRKRDKEASHE